MQRKELAKIISGFRHGLLEGRKSAMMCFAVCAPLSTYLNFVYGLDTKLVEGRVKGREHYWLELPDGDIIDPTADQFDKKMPKVYIGKLIQGYSRHPLTNNRMK